MLSNLVFQINVQGIISVLNWMFFRLCMYSHLSNKRGGWNKRGGGAKNAKSLNVEGVININF